MSGGGPVRKNRRAAWTTALLGALLLLAGCVYVRLLQVKNQLRDFDANFGLTGSPFLSIDLKNPIMKDKDTVFLIGAPPRTVTPEGDALLWHYDFEAVRSSGPLNAPLEKLFLDLRVRGGKLVNVIIPETFLSYFSRDVVGECFKHAVDAEVFKLQKTLKASIRLAPGTDGELPSFEKTETLLGPALETDREDDWRRLTYRYRIVDARRNVPIIARLSFDDAGRMRHARITWDTSTVDVTFLRD
jgi:hypothetical protein